MVKKLWAIGIGLLVGFFVLGFIVGLSGGGAGGETLINIASIIASVVFGMHGNSWREKNLVSRGFEEADTVTAANPEGAIALHLKDK